LAQSVTARLGTKCDGAAWPKVSQPGLVQCVTPGLLQNVTARLGPKCHGPAWSNVSRPGLVQSVMAGLAPKCDGRAWPKVSQPGLVQNVTAQLGPMCHGRAWPGHPRLRASPMPKPIIEPTARAGPQPTKPAVRIDQPTDNANPSKATSVHLPRQPQRQLQAIHQQEQQHEHDDMERDRAHHGITKLAAPDALDNKQVDPDRRRYLPKFNIHRQDDAELDRINR
jgi:hypothetical protein